MKKKGRPKKFKDVNDILENATDEQFSAIHKRLAEKDLSIAGWFFLERLKRKDYTPLS